MELHPVLPSGQEVLAVLPVAGDWVHWGSLHLSPSQLP
jgi:hypothetical protein